MPVLCLWNLSYILWAALSVNLRLRWNLKAFAFDLCGISDLFKSAWRSTRAPTFSFLGWIRCHVSEINSKIGSRFSSFRPETQKALGGENFCTLPYGGVSNSMKLCWNECRDSVWYTVWASGWIVHRLHRIHVSYILKGIFFFSFFSFLVLKTFPTQEIESCLFCTVWGCFVARVGKLYRSESLDNVSRSKSSTKRQKSCF